MALLGTDAYRLALSETLFSAKSEVSLLSAYITVEGIEWVLSKLPASVECKVLTRWNCGDLVSGASDLTVYEKLHHRGYTLHILADLHAKVFLIDSTTLFLGSANLTNSGLRLAPGGNREMGTKIAPCAEDLRVIESLFEESVEVTPALYRQLTQAVEEQKQQQIRGKLIDWPQTLKKQLSRPPKALWVAELLWSPTPQVFFEVAYQKDEPVALRHDAALLGVKSFELEELRRMFLACRAWKWLEHKLFASEDGLYFGQLTAMLHDALLDDPKPYRQDVKTLVANLVSWTQHFGPPDVVVERPSYSQRVRRVR